MGLLSALKSIVAPEAEKETAAPRYESSNSAQQTIQWYEGEGWSKICQWVTELSGRDAVDHIYIGNFDVIPPWVDAKTLCTLFNEDSQRWGMQTDSEGDIVIVAKEI